ncbi:hypothetical protein ACET3Z_008965 [Daucus carota]
MVSVMSHFSPDNRIEQILQPKEDKVVSASSLNTTIAGPPSIITGPPEILASSGELSTSYQPNAYAPLEQSFYYGGYENNAGNWGEYPNYVNANNLQIIPRAMFNDNSSLFYPSGYSFDTQMAYGQFPPLASPMSMPVIVEIRSRLWGHQHRKINANADKIDKARAVERKNMGLENEYYCKSLYWPERGALFSLPVNCMGLGSGICSSCGANKDYTEKENFM